jgi:hypothetical protein
MSWDDIFPGMGSEEAKPENSDKTATDDPLELKDDTLVRIGDQVVPAKELVEGRLRWEDYTRKTQELAEERNRVGLGPDEEQLLQLYRTSPAFRDSLYRQEQEPEPEPVDDETWQEAFTDNPRGVIEESVNEFGGAVKEALDTRDQEIEQRIAAAANAAQVRATWSLLRADIGEDWPEIETRLGVAVQSMSKDDFVAYDQSPERTARLVKELHRGLLKERQDVKPDTPADTRGAELTPAGGGGRVVDTPSKKSVWDLSSEDFGKLTRKVAMG